MKYDYNTTPCIWICFPWTGICLHWKLVMSKTVRAVCTRWLTTYIITINPALEIGYVGNGWSCLHTLNDDQYYDDKPCLINVYQYPIAINHMCWSHTDFIWQPTTSNSQHKLPSFRGKDSTKKVVINLVRNSLNLEMELKTLNSTIRGTGERCLC